MARFLIIFQVIPLKHGKLSCSIKRMILFCIFVKYFRVSDRVKNFNAISDMLNPGQRGNYES